MQLLVVLLLISVVSLFSAKMLMTKTVYVVDKNRDIEAVTMKRNVKGLLNKLDIVLEDADKISPDLKTSLKDGMTITIDRAFPVNVELDGVIQKMYDNSKPC